MLDRRILVGGLFLAACQFGSNAGSASAGVGEHGTSEGDGDGGLSTGGGDGVATAGSITAASASATSTTAATMDDGPAAAETSTGEGNDGSTGGPLGGLHDRGLIARYYLDEAVSGKDPLEVVDAAPNPINLPLSYNGSQPVYTNPSRSQTGLEFGKFSAAGFAGFGSVDQTKFEVPLEGTQATIEVVVQIDQASTTVGEPSQLVWIGTSGNAGKLALSAGNVGFRLSHNDGNRSAWLVPMGLRQVVTLVVDTGEPAAQNRAKLYVDGVLVPSTSGDPPRQNSEISIPNQAWFVLGNKLQETNSFQGTLFYAAIYNEALSEIEVAGNALLLLVDDDTP